MRGYISGTEGNFSIRLTENTVLTTKTGTCKGRIRSEDLVFTDMDGKSLSDLKPSTELKMHLLAYRMRPDIRAVVHAHPTVAVGFTVAGASLSKCVLPEVVCSLGNMRHRALTKCRRA
jgi:L-fuculose-phosphate aldolase